MPPKPRLALVAFWTLCACAYALAIWFTLVLTEDLRLLPFDDHFHVGWPKEADFTEEMCLIVSLLLAPLVVYFRHSRLYVWAGLGIWCFHVWVVVCPVF